MAEFEAFARSVVEDQLPGSKIRTLTRFKSGTNNQTYHVIFEGPVEVDTPLKKHSPATTPIRKGTTQLVIRISDPAAKMTETNRVQNEVASIQIITSALEGFGKRRIVPGVYGWEASDEGRDRRGWIMEEFLQGSTLEDLWFGEDTNISEVLEGTTPEDLWVGGDETKTNKNPESKQKYLVEQLAKIYRRIQGFELPESIKGYGGLSFDERGDIVSAATTIPCGGPFDSLTEMYQQLYRKQLEISEGVEELKGWKDIENLKERIEKFVNGKLVEIVERMPKKKTLIHGDLTMANILVEPSTFEITGIVDFDFSHVACPVDELFWSFPEVGGLFLPRFEEGELSPWGLVRARHLTGFPDDPLEGTSELERKAIFQWPVAKLWHDALNDPEGKTVTPLSLEKESPGAMEDYALVYWLAQAVSPPELLLKRFREKVGPEGVAMVVEKTKVKLQKALDSVE